MVPRALYAAFDRFPSRKGASVHIDRFARALFAHMSGGLLYVLGGDGLPAYQREASDSRVDRDDIEIVRFSRAVPNYLERALAYGARLSALLDQRGGALEICHFRDPWSGIPIVSRPHRYACVYEVNGLPSIELPFAFPGVDPATLQKVRADEERCWKAADVVVVPAETIARNLVHLGCAPAKIVVVPNGADVDGPLAPESARAADAPERYVLYFGALQPWQGIDTLMRAFTRLLDFSDLRLVVCASHRSREVRRYQRLAERLLIADRLVWQFALSEQELAPWRSRALASAAPLRECARNLAQGCAPLKILESMAAGVPVVASDLPAVRELITDGVDGRLVAPDRPADLARALRLLIEYPDERARLGQAARSRIERHFTWQRSLQKLELVYRRLPAPQRLAC
jgi:glycosyltransferase involved in cell wall biosynthesis